MQLEGTPEGLHLYEYADHSVLRRQRFDPIARIVFTVFIGVAGWLVAERLALLMRAAPALWVQAMVGVAAVSLGAMLVYALIAVWINWTAIYVSRDRVEVRHAPLPGFGRRRFNARDIRSVYVYRKQGSHYGGAASTGVALLLKNGLEKKLVTLIYPESHAEFIVEQLHRRWGIGDSRPNDH